MTDLDTKTKAYSQSAEKHEALKRRTISLLVSLFLIAGYIQNIYKLSECDFEAPYKAEVLYGVGLFPPVGVFMGWVDVGEMEDD